MVDNKLKIVRVVLCAGMERVSVMTAINNPVGPICLLKMVSVCVHAADASCKVMDYSLNCAP